MANPVVAYFQIHLTRSKAAFVQLIADWMGILVSDGYRVYQSWQGLRQSCLAHLLRTAKRLAEHLEAGMARFGPRVHTELQRLCHMSTERPTVGPVAGLVCAFPPSPEPPHRPGGYSRDVCAAFGTRRRGAVGLPGRAGCRSHQ